VLTPEGRAEVERVVARAAAVGVRIDAVRHSDRRRAVITAGIVADGLGVADVAAREGLRPMDPVAPVAAWLNGDPGAPGSEPGGGAAALPASLLVVGHLPFLGKLASLLVAGDEAAQVLAFRNAALVRLVPKKEPAGGALWSVTWVLAPELA
jgi:phosphohistidine phosphatase